MSHLSSPATMRPLWFIVGGLAIATVLGQLGRFHWFCELFSHFPSQIALGLSGAIAVSAGFRRWWPAIVAGVFLIPNVVALSYYFPARAELSGPNDLQLLSFNVLTSNHSRAEVCKFLQESEADFIFLMETNAAWLDALRPLESKYPHVFKLPSEDNFGLAFYSLHPIESQEVIYFGEAEIPCLRTMVSLRGRSLTFFGAHPLPPVGARGSASRNLYLRKLAELVGENSQPTIVAGDLNATIWSPILSDFLQQTDLQDTGRHQGFQATWRRLNPLFSIPIDHVLHSNDFACTHRAVGPALGSDHRPLTVGLAWQAN